MEPPDPFSNSEVKHRCANGSVVRPCESRSSSAPYTLKAPIQLEWGLFPLYKVYCARFMGLKQLNVRKDNQS